MIYNQKAQSSAVALFNNTVFPLKQTVVKVRVHGEKFLLN